MIERANGRDHHVSDPTPGGGAFTVIPPDRGLPAQRQKSLDESHAIKLFSASNVNPLQFLRGTSLKGIIERRHPAGIRRCLRAHRPVAPKHHATKSEALD